VALGKAVRHGAPAASEHLGTSRQCHSRAAPTVVQIDQKAERAALALGILQRWTHLAASRPTVLAGERYVRCISGRLRRQNGQQLTFFRAARRRRESSSDRKPASV
jgi:hypothetical protein